MDRVLKMPFSQVYSLLVAKAERKGRTRREVDELALWLTGYDPEELKSCLEGNGTYGDFFRNAPAVNPLSEQVTGKICGVRIEEITDPLVRQVRVLDKLVDGLAKGKTLEKLIYRNAAGERPAKNS